jgi:hypothetical protein
MSRANGSVSLPVKMFEHLKEHGNPETIVVFVIQTHLDAVKKSIRDDKEYHKHVIRSAIASLAISLFYLDGPVSLL